MQTTVIPSNVCRMCLIVCDVLRILHGIGSTPSADLVGSIIGVDHGDDNGFQGKRRNVRAEAQTNGEVKARKSSPQEDSTTQKEQPLQIVWRNVLIFVYLHAAAVYGFYLCFVAAKWSTLLWCKLVYSNSREQPVNYASSGFSSFLPLLVRWFRNHWRSSQAVGASLLQGQVAVEVIRRRGPDARCTGMNLNFEF